MQIVNDTLDYHTVLINRQTIINLSKLGYELYTNQRHQRLKLNRKDKRKEKNLLTTERLD